MLGELLQEQRRKKGWTQKDLALHSGVSLSSIDKMERGKRNPKPITLIKLADALGIDPGDLLSAALISEGERTILEVEDADAALEEQDAMREERMKQDLETAFIYDSYFPRLVNKMNYIRGWASARLALLGFNTAKAIPQLTEVMAQAEWDGVSEFLGVIVLDLANAYTIAGDPTQAEPYAAFARSTLEAILKQGFVSGGASQRVRIGIARAIIMQEEIAFLRGDEERCWKLHEEAKPFLGFDANADHCGWAKSFFYLIWIRLHQGKFQEALILAQEARRHAFYGRELSVDPWWKVNPWWRIRDGVFLNTHWWRLIITTLLLDVLLCSNQLHTSEFYDCFMSYKGQLNTAWWASNLPVFRSRYLWLDQRLPHVLIDYEKHFQHWLRKTEQLGCAHLHTETLISYGDFLRWGKKDTEKAMLIYQEAQKKAQEKSKRYKFLEKIAFERLQDYNAPFHGFNGLML